VEYSLVIAIAALALAAGSELLASRIAIPAAVVQTAVGMLLAFVPGIPAVQLNPEFVLKVVLPVLVYAAAVELPWDEFRRNLGPIATLAFGLVIASVGAVAGVAHFLIPSWPWAAALILGAIVSPTDPVATTAVASRIGVPERLVAIVEGEGLVNDAVALTVKTIAVAALVAGHASTSGAVARFAAIVVGEIAWGVLLGWLVARIRKRVEESSTEIIVSLLTPFAAYLVPEALGGSGVLATVAAGMYIGEKRPELVPYGTRLHLASVWQVIVYALNGVLFLLTGLQFRSIWYGARAGSGRFLLYGAAVAGAVIILRICWTWAAAWVRRLILSLWRRSEEMPPSRHLAFIAWSGMRGSISLAAALSFSAAIPARQPIIFITAFVIALTLMVQGATLPLLIRLLHLDQDARAEKHRLQKCEAQARRAAAAAALQALQGEHGPLADQIRDHYRSVAGAGEPAGSGDQVETEATLREKAISAERRRVIEMHQNGEIPELVLRRIEKELDLQQALLEARAEPPT